MYLSILHTWRIILDAVGALLKHFTRQVHQASSCRVGCKVISTAPPREHHLIKRNGSQKGNTFTWKIATTDSEPTPELLNQTLLGVAQKSVLCRAPSDSDSQWSLRTTVLVDGTHLVLEPRYHPHPSSTGDDWLKHTTKCQTPCLWGGPHYSVVWFILQRSSQQTMVPPPNLCYWLFFVDNIFVRTNQAHLFYWL